MKRKDREWLFLLLCVLLNMAVQATSAQNRNSNILQSSRSRRRQQQTNSNRQIGRQVSPKQIQITSTSPRDGTIVKKGGNVKLSCKTSHQWFFCVWKGPGEIKQCAIQENSPETVCVIDPRIRLTGGPDYCDIEITRVTPSDYGTWDCLVNEIEEVSSDQAQIALEVGQPAEVAFREVDLGSDRTLTITEGETASIQCAATNAHPRAELEWNTPPNADFDDTADPVYASNQTSHTTETKHTGKYKAQLKDDGKDLKCIATQVDRDGRTILYTRTETIKLQVEKLIIPPPVSLTQKIGIISAVLLAIIFLILCCVFCLFAICKKRRRQKRSRPNSSQGTDDTTPDDSQLTAGFKPIWTTDPLHPHHHVPSSTGKHHHGRIRGNGNNNNDRSGNPLYANENLIQDADHQLREPYGQNYTTLLQPPPAHSSPRERGQTQQQGPPISHTISNTTMSTIGGSQGSWEEDRSVGGEVEDAVIVSVAPSGPHGTGYPQWNQQHQQQPFGTKLNNRHEPFRGQNPVISSHPIGGNNPPPLPPKSSNSLPPPHAASPGLETHFDVSDLDYPRTVFHSNFEHPEQPYFYGTHSNPRKQQRPSFSGTEKSHGTPHQRPSSSAEMGSPYNFFPSHNTSGSSGGSARPISALGHGYNDPSPYLHLGRNLPTPNQQTTTSVKSVFDCELGQCFVDKIEEVTEAHIVTTTTVTKPSKDNNVLVTDVLTTETSVTKSHTEQMKPNLKSSKDANDESENLLLPLVTIDPSSEEPFDSQRVHTSEPKDV